MTMLPEVRMRVVIAAVDQGATFARLAWLGKQKKNTRRISPGMGELFSEIRLESGAAGKKIGYE